jgi:hypothetical protein
MSGGARVVAALISRADSQWARALGAKIGESLVGERIQPARGNIFLEFAIPGDGCNAIDDLVHKASRRASPIESTAPLRCILWRTLHLGDDLRDAFGRQGRRGSRAHLDSLFIGLRR